MATRNIVPRADEEGNIGTTLKNWLKGWFKDVFVGGVLTDGVNNISLATLAAIAFDNDSASSEGISTTTSLTYIEKLSFPFTPAFSGDYLIHWACELGSSNANKTHRVKVELDNTTIINEHIQISNSADGYKTVSGYKRITLTASQEYVFDMDYAGDVAQTTAIRKARFEIGRIS